MKASEVPEPRGDEILVVVGPTASGKTELAIRLAERFGGEIVSADSVQIYEHFDLGSGKPTKDELARARHHLVSELDPLAPVDAARFAELATLRIARVRESGRVPIVCGGTFLWVRALVHGLAEGAPRDEALREAHRAFATAEGREALHRKLAEVDPKAALRLAPNDLVRVSRALEVFELTGTPQSEWHDRHGFRTRRFEARLLGVDREREAIDRRIRERVVGWLEAGWIDEVARLLERGYEPARAMGSVGYRQVREHLAGKLERAALEDAIVRATRVFVRRQRTWLRDEPVEYVAL